MIRPPCRDQVPLQASLVDEWAKAWGVELDWAPGVVVWLPKGVCRREGDGWVCPDWFEAQLPRKLAMPPRM